MRLMLTAATLLLTACGTPQPDVTRYLAADVLLPTHQAWLDANHKLSTQAQAWCEQPGADISPLHQAFYEAQRQWASLQPQQVGPLSEGNLSWQVQFYPDKRNLVARQAEELLNTHPDLTTQQLAQASVVVQGLTAFEYVLFDEKAALPENPERYCPLITAIGAHQHQLAARIVEQWQADNGMLGQLGSFPNDRYASATEALADILRVQITGLDTLKKKLGAPLGKQTRGVPQPFQAEAWRSERSLSNLVATIEGAQAVWAGNGVRSLLGNETLADQIDDAYSQLLTELRTNDQSLTRLLASSDGQAHLSRVYDHLNTLHRLHQRDLAAALDITIGFNANDGD